MNVATAVEKKRERKTEEQVITEVKSVLEFARDFFRQRGNDHSIEGGSMNTQTGFFVYQSIHGPRMGFRCSCCSLFCVFPEGAVPRVYHCSGYAEYQPPKPGLWTWLTGEELPRVKPNAPTILRRRQPDEDELLRQ